MKKLLLLIFTLLSASCFALSDSEFKDQYQKNLYHSCFSESTRGEEKLDKKTAHKLCKCNSEKITHQLTAQQLKKYDKNPEAYTDLSVNIFSKCFISEVVKPK